MAVTYELATDNPEAHALLQRALEQWHNRLLGYRIALVFASGWNENADGQIKLGQMVKAGPRETALHGFDLVLILNADLWPVWAETTRLAVIDHELTHVAVDENPKTGEVSLRRRNHDVQEFAEVLQRHGLYYQSLRAFAEAGRQPLFAYLSREQEKPA